MISCLLFITNYARYQSNPRESHMTDVKNIIRYLHKTTSLGLWYPTNTGFFIQAYSDADLGGCGLDRKLTTGGWQFLDGKLVSWKSKKQTYVSLSIVEVEYIVVVAFSSEIIWIQIQLRDYAINKKKIPLYRDS